MKTTNPQRRSHLTLNHSRDWVLWKSWVLATAIAQMTGFSLIAAICAANHLIAPDHLNLTVFLLGTVNGLCLGFFQWLVLRRYLQRSIWWIATTTIGASLAWVLIVSVILIVALLEATTTRHTPHRVYIERGALVGMGVGAILGVSQWSVLRASLRRSFWWIITNAIAWGLGSVAALISADIIYKNESGLSVGLFRILIAGAIGAVIGAITGIPLVKLLKRSPEALSR